MNKIISKERFSEKVFKFEIEAPLIAKSRKAGHFVIVRVGEKGERMPLTIAGSDIKKGTITLVIQEVGLSSTRLCELNEGDYITDVVGPLGQATHIENFGTVVCAGGGVGVAPMLPIVQALKAAGNRVITVLAGRNKDLIILEKEMRKSSDEVIIMTDDGSYGRKGLVTEGVEEVIKREKVDKCFAIGPAIMMKFVCLLTKKYEIPTDVSLNTIMVDGTGMCGACRITVGGKTKFVCVDGPEFDGHQVDFDEMLNIPLKIKDFLKRSCYISVANIEKKLISRYDKTVKYLFSFNDGECVESVVMNYKHGYSICISTQVGCKMGCTFCATGKSGFSRSLTPSEMLNQIESAQKDLNIRISNIVLMGMGEPLDNLEEVLITSDVGVETTLKIIERIEKRAAADKYMNATELNHILRDEIAALLTENNSEDVDDFEAPIAKKPYVIMVVGVNGVGKTTTIGKLAYQFKKAGKSVYLGAADTFRAAAVEQLVIWGERVGVPVVKQKMGADPASVAFDTLSSATANNADVVIIDTAGRLHNKVGLMNELTKIKNVMKKVVPDAPNEVLLVLDGSTGQNAFEQAKQFTLATEVTAMAVTKLDGTAKGGVVIGISDQFKIPVKYIGLGEGMEDLQVFRKKEFVDSLFGENA